MKKIVYVLIVALFVAFRIVTTLCLIVTVTFLGFTEFWRLLAVHLFIKPVTNELFKEWWNDLGDAYASGFDNKMFDIKL
ncbi:MAG: hypothetical protein ACK4EY_16300 [Flavipsychrobacter sp.]